MGQSLHLSPSLVQIACSIARSTAACKAAAGLEGPLHLHHHRMLLNLWVTASQFRRSRGAIVSGPGAGPLQTPGSLGISAAPSGIFAARPFAFRAGASPCVPRLARSTSVTNRGAKVKPAASLNDQNSVLGEKQSGQVQVLSGHPAPPRLAVSVLLFYCLPLACADLRGMLHRADSLRKTVGRATPPRSL